MFRLREFRDLYVARLLSLSGDQIAKVALAVGVFQRSHSPLLAAATFAAGFLPWLVSGPVLSVLADRYRRRDVMIVCDIARAVLVALLALPGVPLAAVFTLLVLVVMLAAPFESARAALLPEVLAGDSYVVGSSLGQAATQGAQVLGYLLGGAAVALLRPSGALLLDAATFVASALLVMRVRRGAPPEVDTERPRLLAELHGGVRVVFSHTVLRWMVLVAWVTSLFSIVPEGLAVSCAAELHHGAVAVSLLVAAVPAGALVGALVIGRFVRPERRLALIRPLAVLTAAPFVITLVRPALWIVVLAWAIAGLGNALHVPAIATFVANTPAALRGRAFGLAQSGLQAVQGIALLVAGGLAAIVPTTVVVAGTGVLGIASAMVLYVRWPAEVRALEAPSLVDAAAASRTVSVAEAPAARRPTVAR